MSEADPSPPAETRAERHLRLLQELAEIGMDLARHLRARAADASAEMPADPGLVFSRIARAVRQTLALEAQVAEEQEARAQRREAEAARLARDTVMRRGLVRKTAVRHAVELAIEAEADGEARENLLEDLDERLDDEDELDFADAPIGRHVARICRDLGLTPDPSLWDDEDWAVEEALCAAPPDGAENAPPAGSSGNGQGPCPGPMGPILSG